MPEPHGHGNAQLLPKLYPIRTNRRFLYSEVPNHAPFAIVHAPLDALYKARRQHGNLQIRTIQGKVELEIEGDNTTRDYDLPLQSGK
jgi:hypothetical protein